MYKVSIDSRIHTMGQYSMYQSLGQTPVITSAHLGGGILAILVLLLCILVDLLLATSPLFLLFLLALRLNLGFVLFFPRLGPLSGVLVAPVSVILTRLVIQLAFVIHLQFTSSMRARIDLETCCIECSPSYCSLGVGPQIHPELMMGVLSKV